MAERKKERLKKEKVWIKGFDLSPPFPLFPFSPFSVIKLKKRRTTLWDAERCRFHIDRSYAVFDKDSFF